MNRFLPILAVIAGLLTLIAAWSIGARLANTSRHAQGLLLAELPELANRVHAIELQQGERTIRIERVADDTWVLASNDKYPADIEEVRSLIVGLSQLEKEQMLTNKSARLGELNLQWPDPENRARLIRLYTSEESPPLEVLLGQERIAPRSTYARRLNQNQAWRCRGGVNADVDPQRWMRRDLLSLPAGEFLGAGWLGLVVTPTATAGESPKNRSPDMFTVTANADTPWTPAQMAAAREVLGNWITRIDFDDVRAAQTTFLPADDRTLTFDVKGARLTVLGKREGDATWFRLQINPRPGASAPTQKPVAGDPQIPDWQAFAKATQGWEFKLPAWREAQLDRLRSDQPEPKAPPMQDMAGKDRMPEPSTPRPAR